MSVRFIAGTLSFGLAVLVACGSDAPQAHDSGTPEGEGGSAGEAGENPGGALNAGGNDAQPGGAAGQDTRAGGAAGLGSGEAGADSVGAGAGSAGECGDEACVCSLGERGCPCDEPSECADGLSCHPELGCANVCVAASDAAFVIEDGDALGELIERQCDTIEGSLWLMAPDIEQVAGLESLKAVSADLIISGAERLATLVGLSGLEAIGGSFVVQDNGALGDLSGLEALRSIGLGSDEGALVISANAELSNIAALASADIADLSVTV
jgi:hypothetical protein